MAGEEGERNKKLNHLKYLRGICIKYTFEIPNLSLTERHRISREWVCHDSEKIENS